MARPGPPSQEGLSVFTDRASESRRLGEEQGMSKPETRRIVLAYSGGLDTSVIVPWLKEHYRCEGVFLPAETGGGGGRGGRGPNARAGGAPGLFGRVVREDFPRDYLSSAAGER